MFPNLSLDLIKCLWERSGYLLILPQPFDDLEDWIDLRYFSLGFPFRSQSGIGRDAQVDHNRD